VAARLSALDILTKEKDWSPDESSLIVLVGDDPFLTRHVLSRIRHALCPDEADRAWAWREFSGADELDPRDVFDEAATVPLFAGATRAAVVREADAFVSAARERLETIAQVSRGNRGVVILDVKSFPANTRLAKAAAESGLVIDVAVPPKADLVRWLRAWAKAEHGIELAAVTVQRLLERLGHSLGQVDQALQRLAAAIDPAARKKSVPPEWIDDIVASPQEKTAWGMIDAAATGQTPAALAHLAELIEGGKTPGGAAPPKGRGGCGGAGPPPACSRCPPRRGGRRISSRRCGRRAWPPGRRRSHRRRNRSPTSAPGGRGGCRCGSSSLIAASKARPAGVCGRGWPWSDSSAR